MHSKTFNLEPSDEDLLSDVGDLYWSSKELTFVGIGVPIKVPLKPLELLGEMENPFANMRFENLTGRDLLPGEGQCGFVSFPFNPKKSTQLLIPKILRGKHVSGGKWITSTSRDDVTYQDLIREVRKERKEEN